MNVTIEFYVPDNSKRVSHNTHTRFSFRDIIWPDLDLCFYLVWGLYSYGTIFISWGAFWQKLGSQLQLRPIPIRNTKRVDFDIWPDLTWFLCLFFFLMKYWLRDFDCRLARLATAPGLWVMRGRRVEYTHPNARLAEYHSGAGLLVWCWLIVQ